MPALTPQQLLAHHDANRYWPPTTGCGLTVPQAYEHALAVRHLRMARGEKPLLAALQRLSADLGHGVGHHAVVLRRIGRTAAGWVQRAAHQGRLDGCLACGARRALASRV